MAWIAVGGAAVSIVGGLIGGRKAKNAARNAKNEAKAMQVKIDSIKRSRASAINPYAGDTDLSSLASDLSSMVTNPFEQLGVATQAAEIQMEQSDIALANTLDTLRSTGAGAGGATALAQAALQSKKGISANIEQQEAQNEKARAQGEASANQQKMSEAQRQQGIAISEGQRLQSNEAAGEQFRFQTNESRVNAELDRASGQQDQARAQEAASNQAQAAILSSTIGAVGSLAGAAATGAYSVKAAKG
tara:strand:- start:1422 stop:2162 length:741 start_codon:yes stop_codon:yes gene_type:complete